LNKRVTGREIFIDDINIPDTLYGGILFRENAPALIRRINIDKAKAMPGVVTILIAEHIPGFSWVFEDEMSEPVYASGGLISFPNLLSLNFLKMQHSGLNHTLPKVESVLPTA